MSYQARRPLLGALMVSSTLCSVALAQDDTSAADNSERASRTYVNVRVGAASSNENGKPDVCVEAAPLAVLSVEACGTGAQVWHDDPAPEMAHFRIKARFMSLALPRLFLQGFVGTGFAELSVGRDPAGFSFNRPSEGLASTSGAELTVATRALFPLGHDLEMIGDLSLAAAYLPHAGELVSPRSTLQPTIALSIGLGF